jgi:nicotinamidase/pyrazinamidase
MSGRIFWDVDTQHDFMKADGRLYVPGSEEIIPFLAVLREYARDHGIRTVASADDHLPDDAELSDTPDFTTTFPPHCMRGTSGQAKIPETALEDPLVLGPERRAAEDVRAAVDEHAGDVLLLKHRFDVFTNPNAGAVLDALNPDEIVLFGVALDVCDRYAVEGLLSWRPDVRLLLVTDAVRAIDSKEGERLLHSWEERGVEMVQTNQIISASAAEPQAG